MMTLVRCALLVLALAAASGCMRWRQVRPLPAPEQGEVSLRAARLATAWSANPGPIPGPRPRLMVLRDVRITADSVIGWRDGADDRVAVHRDQVRVLESRGIDGWKTAGAATLVVLVAYGAAVWYALSQMDF